MRLITIKTDEESGLNYKPGDVFNIRPRNSKEDIDDLFSIFETHDLDIKPHYRLLVEEFHDGKKKLIMLFIGLSIEWTFCRIFLLLFVIAGRT